jgi:DnaJ-domain-containing protein 1
MLYDHIPAEPGFRELFRGSKNRQGLCVLTIMAWIASCDGHISRREHELLSSVAEADEDDADELSAAMDVAQGGRAEDLEVACRYIRSEMSRGAKRLLAQLAITMAVQDGRLTVSENLVLQFLADLLGLSPRAFNKLFEKTAGRPFPQAGDPSSPEWWARREAGLEAAPPADGWAVGSATRSAPERAMPVAMTRDEAWSVLGLDAGAPPDAVRVAYRRLAKKRHPDRFARLGSAAVATATVAFERLREAYELLSSPAASGRVVSPSTAAEQSPATSAAEEPPVRTPARPAQVVPKPRRHVAVHERATVGSR